MNQVLGHSPAAFGGFCREAVEVGDREAAKSHGQPAVGGRPRVEADGVCPVQVRMLPEPGALMGGRRMSV